MKSKEILREKNILSELAKASDAIRRKHRILKSGRDTAQQKMQDVFKPIVGPLEELVSYNKNRKHEIKDERVNIKKEEKEEEEEKEELEEMQEPERMHDETIPDIASDYGILHETIQSDADPLSNADDDDDDDESTGNVDNLISEYLSKLYRNEKTGFDVSYGVRKLAKNKLMIGDSPIHFETNDIYVGDEKFPKSIGLVELLFKNAPKLKYLTPNNLEDYEKIVKTTNAHRKNYKRNGAVRQNKSYKFQNYISNMLRKKDEHKGGGGSGGGGMPKFKVARKNTTLDYVYWDDPNELVDRLRLLLASQAAGNSSHSNEIISIIEELREAEIIY